MSSETTDPVSSAHQIEAATSDTQSTSTLQLIQIGVPILLAQAIVICFLTAK